MSIENNVVPLQPIYKKLIRLPVFIILAFIVTSSFAQSGDTLPSLREVMTRMSYVQKIRTGAECTEVYLPILEKKSVALIANQSSLVSGTHLVDTLLKLGVKIVKIFSPEHGFRGDGDAGEAVKNITDPKSGLPVISLYGKNYKPKPADLKGVDIVIYDIQDVGVRFYTYVSTMHYAMEACAEQKKIFMVLDRPNPNGYYVDGPVLEEKYRSFVGLHPVPLVHGMTMAEFARMILGQGWLKNGIKCELIHILCEGYSHQTHYQLPVKPSPNLPNMEAVYLYPTLGLFEGTSMSIGRGTDKPFQVIGCPRFKDGTFRFIPKSMPGAKEPKYMGNECIGYDLSEFGKVFIKNYKKIYLYWLTGAYSGAPFKDKFFNDYFNRLAGTSTLRQHIIDGVSEIDIRKEWEPDIEEFKMIRKGYLLYPDFE